MMSVDRRGMLQQALLSVGVLLVPGGAEALADAAKSGRHHLDAPRYALLAAVADTIIPKTDTPGAVDVGVPQLVDTLLGAWASPERRIALVDALDKIDRLAREQSGKSYVELSPVDRTELLTSFDATALKAPPKATPTTSETTIPIGKTATTLDPQVGRARQMPSQSVMERFAPKFTDPGYGKLKELIVIGYYCSEAALTTELRYEHNPGAWEPSLPITPDTRPWGGNTLV